MAVKPGMGKRHPGFLGNGPVSDGHALINEDRVAVWWVDLSELDEGSFDTFRALLVGEELERAGRFHFDRDRQVYLAAHGICRALLSYCFGKSPQSWRFSVEAHGKPELVCAPDSPRIRANISHTNGLAAVAVTLENDVGVDVEWRQRTPKVDDLAERMFAASERLTVSRAPSHKKIDTFLAFWTLKEAYVKAIGKGLSEPLDAFSFDLEKLEISFRDTKTDAAANWHFERHTPSADHLLALAVKHPKKARLTVDAGPAPLAFLRQWAGC